eukprot:GHVS01092108.1.p1 GENE.GHVS01092108.1~~GHVS01092108.1.p1  ORF type:complete len:145 (-),score=11.77 GHVS01092108.1:15-449(-)
MGGLTILRLADVIGPYDTTYRCIKTYWSLCCAPPGSVYHLQTWPAFLPPNNVPLDTKRNPLIQKLRARNGVHHGCSGVGAEVGTDAAGGDAGGNADITARLSFTYSGDVTEFVLVLLKHIEGRTSHASYHEASNRKVSVYNLRM